MNESWQNGAAYDRMMGRWSKLVASKFLVWLAIPPAHSWLDVGCGTGNLTRRILEAYQPQAITAVDSSAGFIAYARQSISHPSVQFRVGLAQSLELDTDSVDVVVSGLVLNFVPQPEAAVREMLRVIRPGGTIGIFVWDYAVGMQMLRYFWDAAAAIDPDAKELDEGIRFPICQEGQLEALVREVGIRQVEAVPLQINTVFQNFDDYWQPFLGKVGAAPHYITGLDPAHIQELENRLRASLPYDVNGSISLTARAWAVKGIS